MRVSTPVPLASVFLPSVFLPSVFLARVRPPWLLLIRMCAAWMLPTGVFPASMVPPSVLPAWVFLTRTWVASVILACLLLSPLPCGIGSGGAWAQTGTLQVPAHRQADTPVKPPAAAPVQPVHQDAPSHHQAAAPHHTPVVKPHGSGHAEKPAAHPSPGKSHNPPAKPHAAPPVAATPPAPQPATALPDAAPPAKPAEPEKPDANAQKLPRFAALRSDDVNLRAGPGTRYPIEWVYKRRDLPVEIEREFEVWRLVRDMDGIRGWVHQATLTGRRDFIVKGADAVLRADPKDSASPVAILKSGVIGRIRSCVAGSDWCEMQAGSYRGYLRREQVWGLLPDEVIVP
jgi:SH3-like domain-containing protein